LNSAAKQIL